MARFLINLDRQRELVFGFGAWDILAEKYGPQQGGSAEDFDIMKMGMKATDIPFLIYAGLAEEDPSLTIEKVKTDLMPRIKSGEYTILGLMELAGRALFAQIGLVPKQDVEGDGDAEKKKKTGPSLTVPGGQKGGS